jgi:hypothetical protein
LHSDSLHWIQEYRALASGLGGAGLWLEKVVLETHQAMALDELLARDDALGGLLRAVHALEMDAAGVEELAGEVAALRQKLPAELLGGEERYDPGDPQYLSGLMEDIRELLMHRLLTSGET